MYGKSGNMTTVREYIKVVLLGESEIGKTCLMKRYFKNEFNEFERETIGGAFESKIFTIDNVEYQMGVWDTTGQERYRSICALYYRGAQAAILCYDVRFLQSFRKLGYWITELRKFEPACRIYLCATKADLLGESEASPKLEIVQSYADDWNAKFFVTSAKTNMSIDELFNTIFEDCISEFRHTPRTSTIKLPTSTTLWRRRRKNCCSDG